LLAHLGVPPVAEQARHGLVRQRRRRIGTVSARAASGHSGSKNRLHLRKKKKKITSFGQPTSLIARGRASATLPNAIHLCQTKCQ